LPNTHSPPESLEENGKSCVPPLTFGINRDFVVHQEDPPKPIQEQFAPSTPTQASQGMMPSTPLPRVSPGNTRELCVLPSTFETNHEFGVRQEDPLKPTQTQYAPSPVKQAPPGMLPNTHCPPESLEENGKLCVPPLTFGINRDFVVHQEDPPKPIQEQFAPSTLTQVPQGMTPGTPLPRDSLEDNGQLYVRPLTFGIHREFVVDEEYPPRPFQMQFTESAVKQAPPMLPNTPLPRDSNETNGKLYVPPLTIEKNHELDVDEKDPSKPSEAQLAQAAVAQAPLGMIPTNRSPAAPLPLPGDSVENKQDVCVILSTRQRDHAFIVDDEDAFGGIQAQYAQTLWHSDAYETANVHSWIS
jgi:hypothetical protein